MMISFQSFIALRDHCTLSCLQFPAAFNPDESVIVMKVMPCGGRRSGRVEGEMFLQVVWEAQRGLRRAVRELVLALQTHL